VTAKPIMKLRVIHAKTDGRDRFMASSFRNETGVPLKRKLVIGRIFVNFPRQLLLAGDYTH
jgi:hypothetical protein